MLVGPSGAGKTSVLRVLSGLERPQAGRIALGDEVWLDAARGVDLRPEQRRVGYLPQEYALFPHLSVAGNVRFAAGRPRPDLLERFHIAHLGDERPDALSGGERQRVGLARALAREPKVLLLDEPFAALDTATRRRVRDELAEILHSLPLPTIVVTHAFDDAAAIADRVGVLDAGRIVQIDSPAELTRRPAGPATAAVTGANLLHGTATGAGGGSRIGLDGGGVVHTVARVSGRVVVAVYPWSLRPERSAGTEFADTVVSVREIAGATEVRTSRLLVRLAPGELPPSLPSPGEQIGLTVAPADVFAYPAESVGARGGVGAREPG